MTSNTDSRIGKVLGAVLSAAIVIGAVALGLTVLYHVNSEEKKLMKATGVQSAVGRA